MMNSDGYHLFILITGWLFAGYLTYIIWFRVAFYLKIMHIVDKVYQGIFPFINASFSSTVNVWINRLVFSLAFVFASIGLWFTFR